jgi:hypothetical protein
MGRNLPPGVTTADIDRHYGGHEHEFLGEPDREIFEDGAFMVVKRCARCEAEQYVRLDASSIAVTQKNGTWNTIAESDTNVFHDIVDGDTSLSTEDAENIEASIAEAACDGATVVQHHADGVSIDCGLQERVVYIDGATFDTLPDQMLRVTYDNVSEDVRV